MADLAGMGLFGRRHSDASAANLAAARAKLTAADLDEIRFLLTTKKLVYAVKVVRDHTGLGLKPAKDIIDEIRTGRFVPPATPTRPVRPQGTSLAARVRTLKAAGDLHVATALVIAETGMTDAEAGLFVGALDS
jgi:hypothetical protein